MVVNATEPMAPERKVPITKSDFHVLDEEFQSIRSRFDAEMKKMEEEMARLRSRLRTDDPLTTKPFNSSSSSTSSVRMSSKTSSSEESHSSTHKARPSPDVHASPSSYWTDDVDSPLVQECDDGAGKLLKLRFDVSDYAPDEILVKTVDNKLKVNAKHEEKSENKSVYREYSREFMLPGGVDPELIRSSLSRDGVLTIEAPLPALENHRERTIPIDKC